MSARDRFVRIRKAVVQLATVQALISTCGDDWQPDTVGRSGFGDPTANRAIMNVDVWGVRLEELRAEEQELLEIIGNGLKDIELVRACLSDMHASILDQRYIDGLRWRDVEYNGKRVKLSTGKLKVAEAFGFLDGIGSGV